MGYATVLATMRHETNDVLPVGRTANDANVVKERAVGEITVALTMLERVIERGNHAFGVTIRVRLHLTIT